MQNSIIENDRFSTEKKAAIIRVVAPVQSGSQEKGESPKNLGRKKAVVQFGSVPPYSLVVIGCAKALKFGNKKNLMLCYENDGDSVVLSIGCYTSSIYIILLCANINLLMNELNKLHDYNCNTDSLMVNFQRFKPAKYHIPSPDPNPRQVIPIYIKNSTEVSQYKPSNCVLFIRVIAEMLSHHPNMIY